MQRHLKSFDRNRAPTGLLVSSTDVQRRRRLNSDYEISFSVPMTSADYKEKIIPKGHVQDERGQFYVVQTRARDRTNKVISAQVICTHIMFKMIDFKIPYDQYIEEAYGVHISTLLDRISAATGYVYTFVLHDTFDLRDVKDWGATTALAGLQDAVNLYGCEIEPDNFVIHLHKRIGSDDGFEYRFKKNIISDSFKDDASNLTTRLYSQMKDGRTFIGLSADYLTTDELSLLQSIPGAIVGNKLAVNYLISPYAQYWSNNVNTFYDGELIDQNIEDPEELLLATREALRKKEMSEFEIGVNAADIYKIDPDERQPRLGDTVYAYDPDMELQRVSCRVMELTEYPFSMDKHSQATLSNYQMRDDTQVLADLERSKQILNDLLSGGRIRTSAFEEFAKQAVIDINNSKTELIYPEEGGILARDKTNPNRQVRLTSGGLGISTDGWQTVRSAITADGILGERIIGILGNFEALEIGSGNNIIKLNTNGFSAGHTNFNSAPYRMDMAGNVTMNKLTANAANIYSSSFANGTITGSSIYIGNGTFTVDTYGHMKATSGEFSGAITSSSFDAGTVTGSLIQTSAAGIYPYAAMSSSSKVFSVAASASNRVEMTSSGYPFAGVGFNFINSSQTSSISGNAGLYVYGDPTITMEAMNIYLRGYNGAYVSRWSDFRSEESGTSIQSEFNSLLSLINGSAINMTFDSTSRNLKLWSRGGSLLAQVNIPA